MTDPPSDAFTLALAQELGRKTGVSWLRYDGEDHAVWHVWLEDALYVVSGGDEQPLPDIEDTGEFAGELVGEVEVVMRSKDSGGRLLTWLGEASVVRPGDDLWEPATAALVAGRLNLDDMSTAAAGWAERSVVTRIVFTGRAAEEAGALAGPSRRAVPKRSPATTRGPLPWIIHRRSSRRPRLS